MIVTSSRLNGMAKPDGECRCCSRRSGRSQHHDDLQTKRYHYDCNLLSSTMMMIMHGYYLLLFSFSFKERSKTNQPRPFDDHGCVLCVVACCLEVRSMSVLYFINSHLFLIARNDHTTVTAPLPVCSAKLSTVGPG